MSDSARDGLRIDTSTCRACGLCGTVCPRHVTEIVADHGQKRNVVVSERAHLCMRCGHCATVCPKYKWKRAIGHRLAEVRALN